MTFSSPPAPAAWLQAILDASENPMVSFAQDGQCRGWNSPFLRLLNAESQAPLSAPPCDLPGEVPRWLGARIKQGIRHAEQWHTLALDDGRHFEVCQRPLQIEGTAASLWIFRDVTRLRQLQDGMAVQQEQLVSLLEELATARDAAHRANEAKGQFLANMSHELRTPLHGVIGMTRLAREHTPAGPGRDYLDKAARSAQRLLRLVNEVLDFSKVESGHMRLETVPFDLDDVLEQALSTVELQAREKGLHLTREITSPLLRGTPMLLGDSLRLHQVLINLLGNAVKFTDQGFARLSVGLTTPGETPPRIRFAVSDSGIGLSEAQQRHIFEEFAQGDGSITRKYGGTGLGLAISRRLCRLMGGDLEVSSQPGQGSCFEFSLPLVWAKTPGDKGQSAQALQGVRILLVEDDPISQQLTQTLLRSWGAQVETATNGSEALRHLSALPKNHYALILLDLQMPEMDGFELARQLHAPDNPSPTKLMALSAHLSPADLQRCQELGIADQLLKPFEPDDLLARIQSLLGKPPQAAPDLAPPPEAPLPLQVPGLDSAGGLRRSGGQTELYLRLLRRFLHDYEDAPAHFETLYQQSNWPVLERKAHTLKGLAATLGATALAEAAAQLQDMASTGQAQPIHLALTPLLTALEHFFPPLKTALDRLPKP